MKLPTFREDFIPDEPPGKIEAGTFVYENVAGMDAAVVYLAQLGRTLAGLSGAPDSRSLHSDARYAMQAIRDYEMSLSLEIGRVLRECGAQIYGIDTDARVAERVPTFCFNLPGRSPQAVTEALARANIGIRDGHMYAPRLMRRLGVPVESGVARVSLVHYNTMAEIHRFGNVLSELRPGR
jgi:selenocysteine lyase/cysteine desulfurase